MSKILGGRELTISYRSFFTTRNFDCLISLSFGGTMRNGKQMAKINIVIYNYNNYKVIIL